MKNITRIGLGVLSVIMIVTLTAFSEVDANDYEDSRDEEYASILTEPDDFQPSDSDEAMAYQLLTDYYSDYPGFLYINVWFNDELGLTTFTPVFEGDAPLEAGEAFCRCDGRIMWEIIDQDGTVSHREATEEETKFSYCFIRADGAFIKRTWSYPDVTEVDEKVSIDEHLAYFADRLEDDEFRDFEYATRQNYLNGTGGYALNGSLPTIG